MAAMAIDQLRARRIRSQLQHLGSAIFVHGPRPATSQCGALYHRFDEPRTQPARPWDAAAEVHVVTGDTRACVRLSNSSVFQDGHTPTLLNAAELRALATRLIDAAHCLDGQCAPAGNVEGDAA